MFGFLFRRLLLTVPTLLGVSLVVFILVRLMPGDPVTTMLGLSNVPAAQMQALRDSLGLTEPIAAQYLRYLQRLLSGDVGRSITSGQNALVLIATRVPATVELTVVAMFIGACVAIPLGIVSAMRKNTAIDAVARGLALLGVAAPNFWIGLMLIIVISVHGGLLPASGHSGTYLPHAIVVSVSQWSLAPLAESMKYLLLPALTLGVAQAAILMRLTRSAVLEVLSLDFVRTAHSKGVHPSAVVLRHVLRSALIPIVTVLGLQFSTLLGGAVITETIFAWPGIGRLVVQSIYARDYPVIQAAVMCFALISISISLIVDMLYVAIDPRIKYA